MKKTLFLLLLKLQFSANAMEQQESPKKALKQRALNLLACNTQNSYKEISEDDTLHYIPCPRSTIALNLDQSQHERRVLPILANISREKSHLEGLDLAIKENPEVIKIKELVLLKKIIPFCMYVDLKDMPQFAALKPYVHPRSLYLLEEDEEGNSAFYIFVARGCESLIEMNPSIKGSVRLSISQFQLLESKFTS